MTIHKEGRALLSILFVFLVALNTMVFFFFSNDIIIKGILILGSLTVFLLILQFFRSPKLKVIQNEQHILAPAEGKIVTIEKTREEEYLNDWRIQISIFMSPFNVHINRAPVGGVTTYCQYHPGKYLVAWHPKSSLKNERTTIVIKNNQGAEILVRQIAGAVARRIKYYTSKGKSLEQGQEFGFIKFGSRVDIFLPLDTTIKIKTGDKTIAGKTILGEFYSVEQKPKRPA